MRRTFRRPRRAVAGGATRAGSAHLDLARVRKATAGRAGDAVRPRGTAFALAGDHTVELAFNLPEARAFREKVHLHRPGLVRPLEIPAADPSARHEDGGSAGTHRPAVGERDQRLRPAPLWRHRRVPPSDANTFVPSAMRSFEHDELRLAYDVVGEGFPVILHTGAGGDSRMWRDAGYVGALGGYMVVLFDHRGHGASDAPTDPRGYLRSTTPRTLSRSPTIWDSTGLRSGLLRRSPVRLRAGRDATRPRRRADRSGNRRSRGRRSGRVANGRRSRARQRPRADPRRRVDSAVAAGELALDRQRSPRTRIRVLRRLVSLAALPADRRAGAHRRGRARGRRLHARQPRGSREVDAVILPGLGHIDAFVQSQRVLEHALPFLDEVRTP